MPVLGFDWYSDQLFVLSAGMMELVIGVIILIGVITRLTTFVLAAFMFASNVTFLVTGRSDEALSEMIGHMPIIATAIILLLLGSGRGMKLHNPTLGWGPKFKSAPA